MGHIRLGSTPGSAPSNGVLRATAMFVRWRLFGPAFSGDLSTRECSLNSAVSIGLPLHFPDCSCDANVS
jgi:hypothetical protein